jgi:hypothetical protein
MQYGVMIVAANSEFGVPTGVTRKEVEIVES